MDYIFTTIDNKSFDLSDIWMVELVNETSYKVYLLSGQTISINETDALKLKNDHKALLLRMENFARNIKSKLKK